MIQQLNVSDRCVTFLAVTLALFYGVRVGKATEYTTFIGDANPYEVARVVADSAGNTYIAGTRLLDQSSDVFVIKLDPAGNTLLFRDISGKGADVAADMAIDAAGNIYVGGSTTSVTFPIHDALQSTPGPGFLLKLSADGSELLWSSYFREAIAALAVDSSGNVYVTGTTTDPKFPVTAGLPGGMVGSSAVSIVSGAFLTKISAAGSSIIYSTVISGTQKNCGAGSSCFLSSRNTTGVSAAVDAFGNAYLAGNTDTTNLPTTSGAFLTTGVGAFVMKVKADGSAPAYLTYISATQFALTPFANPANTATAIACDATGDAYLTGKTFDPNFPATKGAYQTTLDGASATNPQSVPTDAFAVKLNPTGSALIWATYLGGSAADAANAIAIDASDQVWLSGTTASADFPNAQGWITTGSDFIAGFDPTGSKLVYSARYPNAGASQSVSVDSSGILHVSGPSGIVSTISPGNAPVPRIWGIANAANGPLDGRIAAGEVISIYGPHIGPATPVFASPDSSGNYPTALNGYQVATNAGTPQSLPLLYLSDSQINAVVLGGGTGSLQLTRNTCDTGGCIGPSAPPSFPTTGVPALPEIFHNPDGSAIALNQDGKLNGPTNPAPIGSSVSIWITGSGTTGTFSNPGQIATTSTNYNCCGIELEQYPATVTYAGTAPGSVLGVSQVTFQIPAILTGITGFNGYAAHLRVVASDGSLSLPVLLQIGGL